ncbi:putative holin [Paraburkholderia dioscoreae]|jgi:hypothetical protein|uniref:Putative phage holin n=1 Tax=Paraburkholderia dioscoreae TaxID=2604047 RepID=A0A5Q4ZE80_9BURK|nr:putative holin [Paraburkholderia dioscoreae]VVD29143.1 putative phage holin [Paraburkholderia dioscoreae]
MAEPVASAAGATVFGLVSGVAMNGLHLPHDSGVLAGIVCGSAMYLMRAREPSRWHKAIYFSVSLVGGFYLSNWAMPRFPTLPGWLVGFVPAVSIVTIAIPALDWVERNVPSTLDRIRAWALGKLPGGKANDDS